MRRFIHETTMNIDFGGDNHEYPIRLLVRGIPAYDGGRMEPSYGPGVEIEGFEYLHPQNGWQLAPQFLFDAAEKDERLAEQLISDFMEA